jgi:hypothetical protein
MYSARSCAGSSDAKVADGVVVYAQKMRAISPTLKGKVMVLSPGSVPWRDDGRSPVVLTD